METTETSNSEPAIGFIGVGALAEYTVRGLRRGGWTGQILLSPRNREVAGRLAADCDARVLVENAAVAAAADIVVLATRPANALAALGDLALAPEQTLLSVVAGLSVAELAAHAGAVGKIVRAMPVTSAEVCASPTMVYPADPMVMRLFDHCGQAVPAAREEDFTAGTALACVYGWFFELFGQLVAAAEAAGLDPASARAMTLGMAEGAARLASEDRRPLPEIAAAIATPGTFTRLGLDVLAARDAYAPWAEAFNTLLDKLKQ